MAKADPPKKKKPSGGLAATVVGTTALKGYGEGIARGLKPYNVETSYQKNTVRRSVMSKLDDSVVNKIIGLPKGTKHSPRTPMDVTQRVTTTKAFSKYGVKTTSTLTETYPLKGLQPFTHYDKPFRTSTRSTTLSPRGKLKGLGQIVIQEAKAAENIGESYENKTGKLFEQGGKGGGKGKFKTKSITYAKEGYPTPKKGRVPKAGNPVISKMKHSNVGAYSKIEWMWDDAANNVKSYRHGGRTGTKTYTSLAGPQSRLGKYVQSKSAAQLLNTGAKAAKFAGKALGAFNVVGTAMLAYDAMKAIDEYSDSAMAKSQMKKYKKQGGFSTSDY